MGKFLESGQERRSFPRKQRAQRAQSAHLARSAGGGGGSKDGVCTEAGGGASWCAQRAVHGRKVCAHELVVDGNLHHVHPSSSTVMLCASVCVV